MKLSIKIRHTSKKVVHKDKTYDQEGCPHNNAGIDEDRHGDKYIFCMDCVKEFTVEEFDRRFKIVTREE